MCDNILSELVAQALIESDGDMSAVQTAVKRGHYNFVKSHIKGRKIPYSKYFSCGCSPASYNRVDVKERKVILVCEECGQAVEAEAACNRCENIYDPAVDSCKYGICKRCLPLFLHEKMEELEMWKVRYSEVFGRELSNEF